MENEQEDYFPRLYSLTKYVGQKAADERTTHFQGLVEIRSRSLKVGVYAFVPAVLISLLFSIIIGPASVLIIPVFVLLSVFLVEKRSRKGMNLRLYRQILDDRASKTVDFYICGEKIDLTKTGVFSKVVKASKPAGLANQKPEHVDVHSLFEPATKNSKRKTPPTAKKSRKS
jgi:hypothetical protein